jgi:hypothetical protein
VGLPAYCGGRCRAPRSPRAPWAPPHQATAAGVKEQEAVNNLEKKFKHGGPSTLDETLDVAITSLQAVLSSDFKPDEVPVCAAGCLFIGSRGGGGGGGVSGVGGWAVGGVAGAGSVLRCVCAPPSVRPSPHVTIHFGPPPPHPRWRLQWRRCLQRAPLASASWMLQRLSTT